MEEQGNVKGRGGVTCSDKAIRTLMNGEQPGIQDGPFPFNFTLSFLLHNTCEG